MHKNTKRKPKTSLHFITILRYQKPPEKDCGKENDKVAYENKRILIKMTGHSNLSFGLARTLIMFKKYY